jgi:hypothetical protein
MLRYTVIIYPHYVIFSIFITSSCFDYIMMHCCSVTVYSSVVTTCIICFNVSELCFMSLVFEINIH